MNKQFSPFLQRYFLIITEVFCNQVKKYRGIFKYFDTLNPQQTRGFNA